MASYSERARAARENNTGFKFPEGVQQEQSKRRAAIEYEAWLEKFETPKTTNNCYTPAAIYLAVSDWAMNEYGLAGRRILRPFHPEGDYENADYQVGDVVIDNPPFSILTKIVRFYESKGVDFFLFAPHLTLFGTNAKCLIVTNADIVYANGAKINTSFVTSLDDAKVRTAPMLKKAMADADAARKAEKPKLPKYSYPDNVITAALLGKIASVDFKVYPNEISEKLSRLDSQKEAKKGLFGGGFLLSDEKAAELKAAELKAAELKAAELKAAVDAIEWPLSEREKELIKAL